MKREKARDAECKRYKQREQIYCRQTLYGPSTMEVILCSKPSAVRRWPITDHSHVWLRLVDFLCIFLIYNLLYIIYTMGAFHLITQVSTQAILNIQKENNSCVETCHQMENTPYYSHCIDNFLNTLFCDWLVSQDGIWMYVLYLRHSLKYKNWL